MNKLHLLAAASACAALVTACGGGGGEAAVANTNAPGSDVPLAATQDPDAAFNFVAGVAATSSDTADPLVIGDASLATSETEEPKPL